MCGRMRGMVVGEGGRSSGVLLYHLLGSPTHNYSSFQHLMSEWLSENEAASPRLPGCHPKVEPLEINTSTGGDPTVEFVKCIPSPQAHSFSRLRRSSISANGPKTPTPSSNGGGVAGGSGGGGPQLDCSIGSAKKVGVCLYLID